MAGPVVILGPGNTGLVVNSAQALLDLVRHGGILVRAAGNGLVFQMKITLCADKLNVGIPCPVAAGAGREGGQRAVAQLHGDGCRVLGLDNPCMGEVTQMRADGFHPAGHPLKDVEKVD